MEEALCRTKNKWFGWKLGNHCKESKYVIKLCRKGFGFFPPHKAKDEAGTAVICQVIMFRLQLHELTYCVPCV